MAEHATEPTWDTQPPGDDVDAVTSAVLTASRLLVAISARSLATVEEHVTLPQFRMLVVLATHGEMKLVTLAGRLAVNPSTAMRMADRLTTASLIDRQVNPANRREIALRLTESGTPDRRRRHRTSPRGDRRHHHPHASRTAHRPDRRTTYLHRRRRGTIRW
jgi:DNA-binding MarR family transcriptional regulator